MLKTSRKSCLLADVASALKLKTKGNNMKDEHLRGLTRELRNKLLTMVEKCGAAEDSFTVPENVFSRVVRSHLASETRVIPSSWIEALNNLAAQLDDRKLAYEAEAFGDLCSLRRFTVNGIEAKEDYFVKKRDIDPSNAPDYGCGNMQATVRPAAEEVLKKYNITLEEYTTIAEDVAEKLSFGRCGKCS